MSGQLQILSGVRSPILPHRVIFYLDATYLWKKKPIITILLDGTNSVRVYVTLQAPVLALVHNHMHNRREVQK